MPTWVATSELGGRHAHRTSANAAPSAYNASTSGHILVDRHLEKNGGTAFRDVLKEAQLNGLCMYWGFQLRSVIWSQVLDRLPSLDTPLRLCIEAHSGIDYGTSWLDRLARLRAVAAGWAARGAPNRLTTTVRMRNPLSHYISFFLWTRVERQARAPERHGRDFAEWVRATPNLQAELLLSSTAAFTASFAGLEHRDVTEWKARWADPQRAKERTATVWRVLRSFDVVGTLERFDESNLVLGRAIGWAPQWSRAPPVESPSCLHRKWMKGPPKWYCVVVGRPPALEKRRMREHVCPDRKKCEALVRNVAPLDHALYEYAEEQLRRKVREGGAAFAAGLRASKVNQRPPSRCEWVPLAQHPPVPDFTARGGCIRGDQGVLSVVNRAMVRPRRPRALRCMRRCLSEPGAPPPRLRNASWWLLG